MKTLVLVSIFSMAMVVGKDLFAQGKPYKRTSGLARSSGDINQWWIGVRGGTNFSNAKPQESYSVFAYTQPATQGNEKNYQSYTLPGLQFGFSLGYEFIRGLSANIFPSYNSYRYSYENAFSWYDSENPGNRVQTGYRIETRLQYIVLPLSFKYELTMSRLKPYIQVGAYYSLLTDAVKRVNTTSIDEASGADIEINVTEISEGINDRIRKNNYGILGGAGFTYNVGNARIGLEVNYQYGLANLDNWTMKYVDNQLITGAYDVPDDFSMDNLELSMQLIIPLKFITSKDYVPL